MTYRRFNIRDLQASVIAATATLVTVLLNGPSPDLRSGPRVAADAEPVAMDALIDADEAARAGAWLAGAEREQAAPKLSFAPEYDRLVWQIDAGSTDVILDARTGEPLEFTFE